VTDGGAWPATDIHEGVSGPEPAELLCEKRVAVPADDHAGGSDQAGQAGEVRVARVVVRNGGLIGGHPEKVDS
jgi:hypothetical protein